MKKLSERFEEGSIKTWKPTESMVRNHIFNFVIAANGNVIYQIENKGVGAMLKFEDKC